MDSATAVLYFTNVDLGHIDNLAIKEYCRNRVICRRELLLKDFDAADSICSCKSMCLCCDVCKSKCKYVSCALEV